MKDKRGGEEKKAEIDKLELQRETTQLDSSSTGGICSEVASLKNMSPFPFSGKVRLTDQTVEVTELL